MFGGSQNKRSRNRSKRYRSKRYRSKRYRSKRYRSKRNRSKFTKKFGKSMRGGSMDIKDENEHMDIKDENEYRRLCKDYNTKHLLFLIITRINDSKGDQSSKSYFDHIYRLQEEAYNREQSFIKKYPQEENKLSLIGKEVEIDVYIDIFKYILNWKHPDDDWLVFRGDDHLYSRISSIISRYNEEEHVYEEHVYLDIFAQMLVNHTYVQQILFKYLYKSIQQKPSPRNPRN